MSDLCTREQLAEARKAARAVYLVTDAAVADDLSRIILGLADALEARVSVLEAESNTTVTPQLVEAVESIMDNENHDNLCGCRLWPASCVTYGNRKPWSYGLEGTLEALAILGTRFPVVPSVVRYPEQETKA